MLLLTCFAVFTTLFVVSRILQPSLAPLPPVLAQFITVGVVVSLLTYIVMPRLTQLFRKWLYPSV